jgi:hypothetical protein
MIPVIMKINIRKKDKKGVKLFFPLFLLWIVLWALLIGLFPLILIIALFLWSKRYGRVLFLIYPFLFSIMWSMSGLSIMVEQKDNKLEFFIK